jgi:hypothetical protein
MGASVSTGISPAKSGSHGYQYILVVGAFAAFLFGKQPLLTKVQHDFMSTLSKSVTR